MTKPPIFDHMSILADPVRSRILLVLEDQELTVSELCVVVQLPQSTVSRHLKILADGGWVTSRRNGTSRLYSIRFEELETAARSLWELTRGQVAGTPAARQDTRRLESVLDRRRLKSREFFSATAGEWDDVRDELFGRGFYLSALLGLLDDRWVVGDLGAGTGKVARSIAPFVQRVVAVDESAPMIEAARRRLTDVPNVELRHGALETLPIEDDELDAATLFLVLHHVTDPAKVLIELARVMRPGGRLLIVDMLPHDRHEYQKRMGHVWMGFSRQQIEAYLAEAGFGSCRFEALPPDPEARGPVLFAASARLDSAGETMDRQLTTTTGARRHR